MTESTIGNVLRPLYWLWRGLEELGLFKLGYKVDRLYWTLYRWMERRL
jgi:hypothetical protein